MLGYERHLLVVIVLALITLFVAIGAVLLDIPLPFISEFFSASPPN